MSLNTRTESGARYALMLTDVFTREARAIPLGSKDPATVNAALGPALENLTDGRKDYVLTTDKGAELSRAEEVMPEQAAHRTKQGPNDIAIADRLMQTLKRDLAASAARKGGDWDQALPKVVENYNSRDHPAVFGPPENAELVPEQEFYVLKANADKFMANRAQSERRISEVKESKTIRAPVDRRGRSFNPSYGNPQKVRKLESDFVTTTGGEKVLLKEAQAVPKGATQAVGRLTDPALARPNKMRRTADTV